MAHHRVPILGLPAPTTHRIPLQHQFNWLAWLDRLAGAVIRGYGYELVHVGMKKPGRIPRRRPQNLGQSGGPATHGRRGFDYIRSAVGDHSRPRLQRDPPDEPVRASWPERPPSSSARTSTASRGSWPTTPGAYRKGLAWNYVSAELGAAGQAAIVEACNGLAEMLSRGTKARSRACARAIDQLMAVLVRADPALASVWTVPTSL
ncbi:hypothetical protein ABZV60_31950 [Streptomyces sp. NPDC004787]|uniref:hypothetical protein n=1 Tax=Streptomyces sp. NPDC004787 TaxID=3154291 RepID=UPI0033A31C16